MHVHHKKLLLDPSGFVQGRAGLSLVRPSLAYCRHIGIPINSPARLRSIGLRPRSDARTLAHPLAFFGERLLLRGTLFCARQVFRPACMQLGINLPRALLGPLPISPPSLCVYWTDASKITGSTVRLLFRSFASSDALVAAHKGHDPCSCARAHSNDVRLICTEGPGA